MANGHWGAAVSGGVGTTTLTDAEFQVLVAGNGLVAGAEYYVSDLPARWVATDGNSYDGIAFVQNGVTYFGDEATAAQTEIDLAAGTWASRPTSGFDTGTVYYRRMTDIGSTPGGTLMAWLGGTSTEWLGTLQPFVQAVSYAASISVNLASGTKVQVGALTGALTHNAPTNIPIQGTQVWYEFTQDGTGGRGITWSSSHKGSWPTASGTASQKKTVVGYSNGTQLVFAGDSGWYS